MSTSRGIVLALVLLSSVAQGARGQTLMLEVSGPQPSSAFSNVLAVVGDLTGDGRPELAVGAPFDGVPLPGTMSDDGFSGSAHVLSGADGAELFAIEGVEPSELLGWSVASAGDVDADGVPDVAVGAPNADAWRGRVLVLSGDGGTPLLEVWGKQAGERFGYAIAPMGDVDSDGHDDLAVGAFEHDGELASEGAVRLLSGATGVTLLELSGTNAYDHFGSALAALGDVDHDGVTDVLVTSALYDGLDVDSGGVSLRSGATGEELFVLGGELYGDQFGRAIAPAGDLTGDGVPDALVGVPHSEAVWPDGGAAHLVSGANGVAVLDLYPTPYFKEFGAALCTAGDLDEDGVLDLAIGAPQYVDPFTTQPGRVSVFAGAGGALLTTIVGAVPQGFFGSALAATDLDDDGAIDLVVGAPYEGGDPTGPGMVEIYSGDVWLPLGTGTPGSLGTPDFEVQGEPVVGEPVSFIVQDALPGASAVLVVGASALMAPFKGGTLVPNPDWFSPVLKVDNVGVLSLAGPWPPGAPAGMEFYFQWWVADPGAPKGWASTEGVLVTAP